MHVVNMAYIQIENTYEIDTTWDWFSNKRVVVLQPKCAPVEFEYAECIFIEPRRASNFTSAG